MHEFLIQRGIYDICPAMRCIKENFYIGKYFFSSIARFRGEISATPGDKEMKSYNAITRYAHYVVVFLRQRDGYAYAHVTQRVSGSHERRICMSISSKRINPYV